MATAEQNAGQAMGRLYPAYRAERRRLLSNAACMLKCVRQYGPYWLDTRKHCQRELVRLRRVWTPVRASKAVQS